MGPQAAPRNHKSQTRIESGGACGSCKKFQRLETFARQNSSRWKLLAHDPRRITEASALGVPLVLSGHTHGGQVVLPGLGAIAAQKFPIAAGTARQLSKHVLKLIRRRA